jgi:multidrug efflux pump subunit AcrA (membrane-fusion protein)
MNSRKSLLVSPPQQVSLKEVPATGSWNRPLVLFNLAIGLTISVYFMRSYLRQPLASLSAGEQEKALSATEFIGKVQPAMQFKIAALSSGIVKEVYVQVGEQVKTNQPLMVLENSELLNQYHQIRQQQETAQQQMLQLQHQIESTTQLVALMERTNQANMRFSQSQLYAQQIPLPQRQDSVQRAEATYSLALSQYNRMNMLYQEGAISQADLDKAEAELLIAEADMASAVEAAHAAEELAYNQAQQLALQYEQMHAQQQQQLVGAQNQFRMAQLQYEQATQQLEALRQQGIVLEGAGRNDFQLVVRATNDGVVSTIPVSLGDQVYAGAALVELSQINRLNVEIPVSSRLVNSLHTGQRAIVEIGTGESAQAFDAEVFLINPLPSEDLTHSVKIQFDNPAYTLLAGQPAKVRFVFE